MKELPAYAFIGATLFAPTQFKNKSLKSNPSRKNTKTKTSKKSLSEFDREMKKLGFKKLDEKN